MDGDEDCLIEYVDAEEINDEITETSSENKLFEQEIYNCSACKQSFADVMDHIKRFHKNQSVLIEANGVNDCNEQNFSNNKNEIDNSLMEENIDKDSTFYISDNESNVMSDSNDVVIFDVVEMIAEEKINEEISLNYIDDEFNQFEEEIKETIEQCSKSLLQNNIKGDVGAISSTSKTCLICKTTFPSVKNLKLHARMHNPVKSKSYDEAIGNNNKDLTLFHCDLCGKSFDIKLKNQHSKFHQENNKTCNMCNKEFKNEDSFRLHMTLHEVNGNPSISSSLLKKLTKSEKAGIVHPYACQHCGRSFKRPHEKVKHERIHTGEKPFKCDVCGKSFRVSYSLTLHLRTHTGIRPYVCATCNKRFKGYSTYAHHLLTHSDERNFKCSECPKTFKTAVQLHGHKNTHSKPFFCKECNRPFATMYAVEVHMETHKKGLHKKKFKYFCDICGASYGKPFALEEHKKEAHSTYDIIEKNLQYFCNEETIVPVECILSADELFKE